MSEYWKSNAKKFCEICKVWFADNKISIDNHERGLKHKGMVQARLREISRNADEKERANEKLASTLMQMEQAAIMSMNRGASSSGPSSYMNAPVEPVMPKKSEYEEAKEKVRAEKERMKQLKRTAKQSTLEPRNTVEVEEKPETFVQEEVETAQPNIYYDYYQPEQPSQQIAQMPSSYYKFEATPSEFAVPEPQAPIQIGAERTEAVECKKRKIIEPEEVKKEEQEEEIIEEEVETISKPSPFGPWVPVKNKPETIVQKEVKQDILLDDLPEEASQIKEMEPTFDEVEAAELTFEERKAPVSIGGKKTKVVEFKKRKTINRNVRAREEF